MDASELSKLAAALKTRTKITQSNFVIDMRYDYEFVQLHALWLITERLQPIILKNIYDKTSLFIETDQAALNKERNEVEVVIPLHEFGYQRNRYDAVREALSNMACIQVTYAKESYKIRKTVQGKGALCSYVAFSRAEDDLRRPVAHFFFSLDIATCLVSPKIGFTDLLQGALYSSKNVYTAKIYMYISRSADMGKLVISYEELREKLCVGDKFRRYYDFRNRVLKEAENELREKSNYWFSLVEVFSRKGAEAPLKFIFNIFSVDDNSDYQKFAARRRSIYQTMTETLRIKEGTAKSFIQQITIRNINYVWRKHNSILTHMVTQSESIKNRMSYYIGTMQRIIDTEKYGQPVVQQNLFQE